MDNSAVSGSARGVQDVSLPALRSAEKGKDSMATTKKAGSKVKKMAASAKKTAKKKPAKKK